jgi:hypothetical protein
VHRRQNCGRQRRNLRLPGSAIQLTRYKSSISRRGWRPLVGLGTRSVHLLIAATEMQVSVWRGHELHVFTEIENRSGLAPGAASPGQAAAAPAPAPAAAATSPAAAAASAEAAASAAASETNAAASETTAAAAEPSVSAAAEPTVSAAAAPTTVPAAAAPPSGKLYP